MTSIRLPYVRIHVGITDLAVLRTRLRVVPRGPTRILGKCYHQQLVRQSERDSLA